MEKMNAVNKGNCHQKQPSELQLIEDVVHQPPTIDLLKKGIILANRTQLLHTRNMAHKNAILYSYQLQNLFDFDQPGLMYYYLHAAADISGARSYLNQSGIIYDTDKAYAHWYKNYFNKTVPRYGPLAWRDDDFYDAFNWKNKWTNQTMKIMDLGAGRANMYTSKYYKGNDWYFTWLPDPSDSDLYNGKVVHYFTLTTAKRVGEFNINSLPKQFYGPPGPMDDPGPEKWTKVYFDCGRSNKWIISAVSPIVDVYPRHTEYRNIQSFRYLAVATASVDFLMMDINQCADYNIGSGSYANTKNYFANTDKCKPTTRCEPIRGFGFRRGGYQCMCQPGYRYPPYQNGPFKGYIIEKATWEEYKSNFDCIPVDLFQQVPLNIIESNTELISYYRKKRDVTDALYKSQSIDGVTPNIINSIETLSDTAIQALVALSSTNEAIESFENKKNMPVKQEDSYFGKLLEEQLTKEEKTHSRVKRYSYEPTSRINSIFAQYEVLASDYGRKNCPDFSESQRRLPGDVIYGADTQFESQAKLALSIAHFLTSFYQIINPDEDYPLRHAERALSEDQLYAEVISAVAADFKVVGVGIFYDRNKFDKKEKAYFGPYAFRNRDNINMEIQKHYQAVDLTGMPNGYIDEEWFQAIKSRWAISPELSELEQFYLKPYIRGDYEGRILVHYESGFPQYFYAAKLKHGQWFAPRYQCDYNGILPRDWIITYAVPFFGKDQFGTGLEFRGVVRVDVKLDELDINQCYMPYYEANAFKNSDRCDYYSTICIPTAGKGFVKGGYKCQCRAGFEYPFLDKNDFYPGDQLEKEWFTLTTNASMESRFFQLKCRIAKASSIKPNTYLILISMVFLRFTFFRK